MVNLNSSSFYFPPTRKPRPIVFIEFHRRLNNIHVETNQFLDAPILCSKTLALMSAIVLTRQ